MAVVLDASALLAMLHNEQGADKVEAALFNKAVISTVNWTEVIQKAIAKNIRVDDLDNELYGNSWILAFLFCLFDKCVASK